MEFLNIWITIRPRTRPTYPLPPGQTKPQHLASRTSPQRSQGTPFQTRQMCLFYVFYMPPLTPGQPSQCTYATCASPRQVVSKLWCTSDLSEPRAPATRRRSTAQGAEAWRRKPCRALEVLHLSRQKQWCVLTGGILGAFSEEFKEVKKISCLWSE